MTLHERLEAVFREVFDDESLALRDEMTAADIAGWDSLQHMNLMFTIDEVFGVQFSGNQLAEFESIGALKQFLESRQP